MIRTVYVDLLFLINFSMDFLCFFLVSGLFMRRVAIGRTVAASLLGGIYAVSSLFLPFRGMLLLLCDFCACAVMCLVVHMRKGIRFREMLTEILVYAGISMALGGVMTALYSMLNEAGIPEALAGNGDGISTWLFLLLAAIGGGATMLGSRMFRRGTSTKRYDVTVRLCGREQTFRALVDTGNYLADPISGCPAAVIDRTAARGLLPKDFRAEDSAADCMASLPEEYRARARLLPIRTVTGEGMVLAFRVDRLCVTPVGERENGEERALLLAIAPLEREDSEMLLPPGRYA